MWDISKVDVAVPNILHTSGDDWKFCGYTLQSMNKIKEKYKYYN